jgi:hypothetical protein
MCEGSFPRPIIWNKGNSGHNKKDAYREQLEGCVGYESIAHSGIPFCHEVVLR